jgi:hypothetical protein
MERPEHQGEGDLQASPRPPSIGHLTVGWDQASTVVEGLLLEVKRRSRSVPGLRAADRSVPVDLGAAMVLHHYNICEAVDNADVCIDEQKQTAQEILLFNGVFVRELENRRKVG